MANEDKTVDWVKEVLKKCKYQTIESKKSDNPKINAMMLTASKKITGKQGFLDVVAYSFAEYPEWIVLIECKAKVNKHWSAEHKIKPDANVYADYAVDGALFYASYLAKEFNVIAIGASGETKKDGRINVFVHPKNGDRAETLKNLNGNELTSILPISEFVKLAMFSPLVELAKAKEAAGFSKKLANLMRDKARLSEAYKPLIVAGCLIALQSKTFRKIWREYANISKTDKSYQQDALQLKLYDAIHDEIKSAKIPFLKSDIMLGEFSFIKTHEGFFHNEDTDTQGPLFEIIEGIEKNISTLHDEVLSFDVIGQFYGEFLKYSGGDGKGLGIVLTPKHITELFVKIADVNKHSVVMDITAGTAGFLIAAMDTMFKDAANDKDSEAEYVKKIKKNGLIGIEEQTGIFTLGASNMILRGDGKSQFFNGDCFKVPNQIFNEETGETIGEKYLYKKATVGLINPPYSQKGENKHELNFVIHMLDMLKEGACGMAIVPMSCAIANDPKTIRLKNEILKKHTLISVMSMPDDLFYPTATNTCIMVFEAHRQHKKGFKTYFGYWKEDGFVKTKTAGRADIHGRWNNIRDRWLESLADRTPVTGLSVLKEVVAADEWCAEEYLEYKDIDPNTLEGEVLKTLKQVEVFNYLKCQNHSTASIVEGNRALLEEIVKSSELINLKDLFTDIKLSKPVHKIQISDSSDLMRNEYTLPYITRTAENNGCELFSNQIDFSANIVKSSCITVGAEGITAFYQERDFFAGNKVSYMRHDKMTKKNAMLIIATLNLIMRKKCAYGRAATKGRLEKISIPLPVIRKAGKADVNWALLELYVDSFFVKSSPKIAEK